MIQSTKTDSDVGDVELLHAPIWFAKYNHKDHKIVLVVDANSGRVINSHGLQSARAMEAVQEVKFYPEL